jgi:hypothetical protein
MCIQDGLPYYQQQKLDSTVSFDDPQLSCYILSCLVRVMHARVSIRRRRGHKFSGHLWPAGSRPLRRSYQLVPDSRITILPVNKRRAQHCWHSTRPNETRGDSSGVYICKSVVNDLRHGNYICKSEQNVPVGIVHDQTRHVVLAIPNEGQPKIK